MLDWQGSFNPCCDQPAQIQCCAACPENVSERTGTLRVRILPAAAHPPLKKRGCTQQKGGEQLISFNGNTRRQRAGLENRREREANTAESTRAAGGRYAGRGRKLPLVPLRRRPTEGGNILSLLLVRATGGLELVLCLLAQRLGGVLGGLCLGPGSDSALLDLSSRRVFRKAEP